MGKACSKHRQSRTCCKDRLMPGFRRTPATQVTLSTRYRIFPATSDRKISAMHFSCANGRYRSLGSKVLSLFKAVTGTNSSSNRMLYCRSERVGVLCCIQVHHEFGHRVDAEPAPASKRGVDVRKDKALTSALSLDYGCNES